MLLLGSGGRRHDDTTRHLLLKVLLLLAELQSLLLAPPLVVLATVLLPLLPRLEVPLEELLDPEAVGLIRVETGGNVWEVVLRHLRHLALQMSKNVLLTGSKRLPSNSSPSISWRCLV